MLKKSSYLNGFLGFNQFLNWLFLETSKAANENAPHTDEANICFVLQGLIKSSENDSNVNGVENNTKTTMLTWSTLFPQELSCKCNTGEVTLASLR